MLQQILGEDFRGGGVGCLRTHSHSPGRQRVPTLGSCDGYCVSSYSNLERNPAPRRGNAKGVPMLGRSRGWGCRNGLWVKVLAPDPIM